MILAIEFTFESADPRDAMSSDNVDIKEILLDDQPLTADLENDVNLQTALLTAIYRLKAILPNASV
jgi:hypothetical protein